MMGKEARALGAVQQKLAHSAIVIAPQLLHQLRQEEGDLHIHPVCSARWCGPIAFCLLRQTSDALQQNADMLGQRQEPGAGADLVRVTGFQGAQRVRPHGVHPPGRSA